MYTYIPTLQHIPRSAWAEWSHLFCDVTQQLNENIGSPVHWKKFFLLPKAILPAMKPAKDFSGTSMASKIKDRIKSWRQGNFMELWNDALSLQKPVSGRKKKNDKSPESQEELNARRGLKLAQEGQYGNAAKALLSTGLAPSSEAVLASLREKHPQRDLPEVDPNPPSAPPLQLTRDQLQKGGKIFQDRLSTRPIRPKA